MDVSQLTIKLPVDQFYDTYVATIRDLYTSSFIAQNHLEPSTKSSFKRAMSKRAGISLDVREDTDQYTRNDLIAIVNDTNAKYQEYANGDYSDSTKKRGVARYRLLSVILQEAFNRLGYSDIAAMFTCTEEDEKEVPVKEEKKEEDTAVEKNTKMLRESLRFIEEQIQKFSDNLLSDKEKKKLQDLNDTLRDTLASAAKCAADRTGVDDLKDLIRQGEEYAMKLEEIIKGDKKEILEQMADQPERVIKEEFDVPFTDIIKVLKILPGFVENLQGAVDQNVTLVQQVKDLRTELDIVKQQTVLPDSEDDLVKLAKDIINKIEDKGKLKDIGMVIMMKAL